jgi:hypothetical protein
MIFISLKDPNHFQENSHFPLLTIQYCSYWSPSYSVWSLPMPFCHINPILQPVASIGPLVRSPCALFFDNVHFHFLKATLLVPINAFNTFQSLDHLEV